MTTASIDTPTTRTARHATCRSTNPTVSATAIAAVGGRALRGGRASVVITVPTWIRGRPAARDARAWRPFVGEHGQMAATVGIDRARVLDTAIELIDAEGYDTLSMTKLAASLGIRVPS